MTPGDQGAGVAATAADVQLRTKAAGRLILPLMIPCSKLTDRWGRKRCFIGGLTLYGIGALASAASPNLGC